MESGFMPNTDFRASKRFAPHHGLIATSFSTPEKIRSGSLKHLD
jgi:hypothetical protein